MVMKKAHGTGAPALLRVETAAAQFLPDGEPGAEPAVEKPGERDPVTGRFLKGTRTAQVKGGKTARGRRLLSRVTKESGTPGFDRYQRQARAFARLHCQELATNVGGGICGPGPSSIVASASLMLAWSRFLSEQAAKSGNVEDVTKSAALADKARQALLTAHELCAREATARARRVPTTAGTLAERLLGEDEEK